MVGMRHDRAGAGRLGSRETEGHRAAMAGMPILVLAVVIIFALALTGCSSQPSRPSGNKAAAAPPALAVTTFAGYPGQLPLAHAPRLTVNALTAAEGVRLAVGSADGYPAVWRRAGGGSWTLVTSMASLPARSRPATLSSVVHGPAGWLAVGTPGPVVLTSVNGTTWRPASGPVAANLAGVSVISAAAGPRGYVILGKLAVAGGGCVADVWWSPDMRTWVRARDVNEVTGSSQTLAVAAEPDGFVSVGSHQGKPAVWVTSNGRVWRTIVLPLPAGAPNAQLNQIAVSGSRVVATGGPAVTGAPTRAFAELSADGGATWREIPLSLPQPDTTVTALTASPRGFAAAGQYGGTTGRQKVVVWTLGAGSKWAQPHVSGITGSGTGRTREITALEATESAVTGIGPVAPALNRQAVVFTLLTR
jgi:hypothetical protein